MASIKNQIANYVAGAGCLALATGMPSGLTVRSGPLVNATAARLPEMGVYVGQELRWDPVGQRRHGNPVLRGFRLHIDIRAQGTLASEIDDVLDPLEVWAEKRLFADETFGGLGVGIVGYGSEPRGVQADKSYYLSSVYVDIEFTTQRGLPETRGDA
jgi:hypothetical protein